MKKKIILVSLLGIALLSKAQVGINNSAPAATLDVTAKTTGAIPGTPEGLISPRLTLLDLNQKSSAYTTAQTGTLIYVTDASNDTPAGKTIKIVDVGYYYFDGSIWQRINTGTGTGTSSDNIYTSNGTLGANRTVAMADKTLSFTSGTPTVNQFNVDGTVFSVDTQNDRIGVGTATPQRTQHVSGSLQITNELNVGGNATTAGSAGTIGQILTSGGPGAAPIWKDASTGTGINIYTADGTLTGNRTVTQGANTLTFTGTSTNAFSVDGTTLSVDAANNRTGIGTTTPQRTQHVNGSLQITNEFNVGGDATTAGNAGTADQILVSSGPGAAPQWKNMSSVSGGLASANYVQGTSEITVNQGTTADVPGVSVTLTVPAGRTQTLFFTIQGYSSTTNNSFAGQGVFSLLQNGVKISSAYSSSGSGGVYLPNGTLLTNLPHPTTFIKSISLPAGTYTFKVQYSAWANNHIINKLPSNYVGYNGDTEAMLTKMTILVFND
ncbi:autotransporter outer membrane beta-barrel domain-containing protein [Chryseobacterium populi]|uniref:Uncharacterized protein n=1 Tax=Chryseobacterium populi TaxID=1144316 RepID=J3CFM9_9FLAO|nr:hypothetical protein [Chryseobacterium populi]EJL70451.1 hypothetical protein PMI13_02786 [Chryseobacterium populi]